MPLATMLGDEGAGAGADVDVELVDRAVDGEQVERAQGPDLVDAAREPAAAEDERGLGLTPATSPGPSSPRLRPRRLELDDLPHELRHYYLAGQLGSLLRAGQDTANRGPGRRLRALRRGLYRRPRRSRAPTWSTGWRSRCNGSEAPAEPGSTTSTRPTTACCSAGRRRRRARSPRTRSCSRRRRCSTGSGRTGDVQDQGLSAEARRTSTGMRSGATSCWSAPATRRSRAAASPAQQPARDAAGLSSPREVKKDGHQAGDRQGARRRLRSSTASGASRRAASTPRASSSPLSGLSYDSGFVHGHYATNPELVAARALTDKLRHYGVQGQEGHGPRRPLQGRRSGTARWRRSTSPSMSSLITATNRPSNNFFAEMLLKRLAAPTASTSARRAAALTRSSATPASWERRSTWSTARAYRAQIESSPNSVGHLLARDETRAPVTAAFRNSLPLAGARGDARGPHGRHRGGGQLPREDRDPERGQRPVGLLPGRPRHGGLLDPHELGERHHGPERPGQDGGAHRAVPGVSPGSSSRRPVFVEDGRAQLLRLGELRARGCRRRPRSRCSSRPSPSPCRRRADQLGRLLAGEVRQRAGEHERLALERAALRPALGLRELEAQAALAQPLDQLEGAARRRAPPRAARRRSGRRPRPPRSASASASISASIEPKCSASAWAVT